MPAVPYKLLRPLLFAMAPETAHRLAITALRATAGSAPPPAVLSKTVMGLSFTNPLGLAAGFDKNADAADAAAALGFGFVESGAITPLAQPGNPHPRIFRLPQAQALINRMGFNNCGMVAAARHLRDRRKNYILGINLGKNATTPLVAAAADYNSCMQTLYDCGDFFTINISSPNTPGLQKLQTPDMLQKLLAAVVQQRNKLADNTGRRAPLAVKLSPDLSGAELDAAAMTIAAAGIDGVIACNTTNARPPAVANLPHAAESGGLSGAPLAPQSLAVVRRLRQILPASTAIIGVGGIMNGDDARARMEAGADLLQLYTGLIYHGPGLPRWILSALQKQPPRPATGV